MKVFVKRYPEKGELPIKGGEYYSEKGIVFYNKNRREFEDYLLSYDINIEWWLEEIELPDAEDIRREALGSFKEKDLEDQYGDFIQDDIDTFTKGANYILNLLKQK